MASSTSNLIQAAPVQAFVISRTFDAPREQVWKAWTDPKRLMRWFGPKGSRMLSCKMDLRPGGMFHYRMRYAGLEIWGKFVYREIVPPARLVLVNSFSDAQGGVTRHPFGPTWPIQMLSTTTLAERDGTTMITIRWAPVAPTADERATFEGGHASMRQGWTGTFNRLGEYLATAGRS